MSQSPAGLTLAFGTGVLAGGGDFAGGVASKRANPIAVVAVSHTVGLLALLGVLAIVQTPLPAPRTLVLGALAGLVGALATAALFRALATGAMSVASPVSAIVGALVPIVFGFFADGPPGWTVPIGFGLALFGIALVNPVSASPVSRRSIELAALAGLGFGTFLVLLRIGGGDSPLWIIFAGRAVSAPFMALLALRALGSGWPRQALFVTAAAAGLLDTFANVCFAAAIELVRVDVAAMLYSLYPAFTVALAFFVLREPIRVRQGLGIFFMIASLPLLAGP